MGKINGDTDSISELVAEQRRASDLCKRHSPALSENGDVPEEGVHPIFIPPKQKLYIQDEAMILHQQTAAKTAAKIIADGGRRMPGRATDKAWEEMESLRGKFSLYPKRMMKDQKVWAL